MLVWATFERTIGGGRALQTGAEIRDRSAPRATFLILSGLMPTFQQLVINGKFSLRR